MRKDVKFHRPANRLLAALDKGERRTLREGIRAATRNLSNMSSECLEHVDAAVGRLEDGLAQWPDAADAGHLSQLYEISVSIIGVASVAGVAEIDTAAKSLCDVIDGMITRGIAVREPIAVHVQAMRLLLRPEIAGAGEAVIQGLLSVRKRFAPEPPASKPPHSLFSKSREPPCLPLS